MSTVAFIPENFLMNGGLGLRRASAPDEVGADG